MQGVVYVLDNHVASSTKVLFWPRFSTCLLSIFYDVNAISKETIALSPHPPVSALFIGKRKEKTRALFAAPNRRRQSLCAKKSRRFFLCQIATERERERGREGRKKVREEELLYICGLHYSISDNESLSLEDSVVQCHQARKMGKGGEKCINPIHFSRLARGPFYLRARIHRQSPLLT